MRATSGPWMVDQQANHGYLVSTQDQPVHEIALVYINQRGLENAHLISAAPEMFETLQILLHECCELRQPMHMGHELLIKSIIDKAEGRIAARKEMATSQKIIGEYGL